MRFGYFSVDVYDLLPPVEDEKVHGVVIATITSSHEELVMKSLNAGKAVFCEKPVAETYDGTGELPFPHCSSLMRLRFCRILFPKK